MYGFMIEYNRLISFTETYHKLSSGLIIEIPTGWATDGATIPRYLWSLIEHPFGGSIVGASVIHDIEYELGFSKRKDIDYFFYTNLIRAGISRIKATLIYRGVRIFGSHHFSHGSNAPLYGLIKYPYTGSVLGKLINKGF